MGTMLLRIVKPPPDRAMLSARDWLSTKQVGRPSAVMRLQPQFVASLFVNSKSVRDSAASAAAAS
jgi:hypothetical protein